MAPCKIMRHVSSKATSTRLACAKKHYCPYKSPGQTLPSVMDIIIWLLQKVELIPTGCESVLNMCIF